MGTPTPATVQGPAALTAEDHFGLDAAELVLDRIPGADRRRSVLPALVASDVIALAIAFFGGYIIDGAFRGHTSVIGSYETLPYLAIFLPVFSCYGLYRRGRRRLVASAFPDLSHLVHAVIVGCLLTLVLTGWIHRLTHLTLLGRANTAIIGLIAVVAVPVLRATTRWVLRGSATSRVLIVGSGQVAAVVLKRLAHVDAMELVGCVDDGYAGPDDEGLATVEAGPAPLGTLDDLPDVVRDHDVDHVIVAFSPASGAKLASLLRSLADDVKISVVPRLFDLLTVRSHVDDLHGLPVVDVAPASLGPADRVAKRAMDIAVSAGLLLLTAPVTLVIALAVKLTSPGPVLFRQDRTGRSGTTFRICKFRTMREGAEQERLDLAGSNEVDGPVFKIKNDPRVTRVGAVLRKTSLDELPQLLNVLKGDMSLVGPRPFVTAESAAINGWAARRFDVRPGMTGMWQISGRNDLPFAEMCRLDYSYVASWSLWWDMRIMWHTPASVLRRRGAY